MEKGVQDNIDRIYALARASKEKSSLEGVKDYSDPNDSLGKLITNEKEAKVFMAELNAVIKMADEERELSRK